MQTLRITHVAFAFVSVVLLSLVAHADDAVNPRYQAWAKYGVGSSETLQASISMGAMQMTTTITMTLDEVTPDHVIIETTATMDLPNGQRQMPPRKQTIQAKGDMPDITHDPDEDVEAAGKTFHCKVIEAQSPIAAPGGATGNAKVWYSSDVPGGIVKLESSGSAAGQTMQTTYLLQSFDAK